MGQQAPSPKFGNLLSGTLPVNQDGVADMNQPIVKIQPQFFIAVAPPPGSNLPQRMRRQGGDDVMYFSIE